MNTKKNPKNVKIDLSHVVMAEPHISHWIYMHNKIDLCLCLRCRVLRAIAEPAAVLYTRWRGVKHGGWKIEK